MKLGPGGIREIEFIVQAYQLIRGGSDPRLRTQSLLEVLPLLEGQKLLPPRVVAELRESYLFLRRLENRLQQRNDEADHDLPEDRSGARSRSAWARRLGRTGSTRSPVTGRVSRPLPTPAVRCRGTRRRQRPRGSRGSRLWATGARDRAESDLRRSGSPTRRRSPRSSAMLRDSAYYRSPRRGRAGGACVRCCRGLLRELGDRRRRRRVRAAVHVLERIGGRTVYLALLNENALARRRLVEICTHSKFLTDRSRRSRCCWTNCSTSGCSRRRRREPSSSATCAKRMTAATPRIRERQVDLLRQFQHAAVFRVAVPDLTGRMPVMKVSDRLTDIARLIVAEAHALSWEQITARHGVPRCGPADDALREAGLVVVAYGKFGGIELGYGSDLDSCSCTIPSARCSAPQARRWSTTACSSCASVQRLVHLLTDALGRRAGSTKWTRAASERQGGLLVWSLDGFAAYQRSEADTGSTGCCCARAPSRIARPRCAVSFEALRLGCCASCVRRDRAAAEVRSMRERMRAELAGRGARALRP